VAKITFTPADVARLLGLEDARAVERLIHSRTIEIFAYTRRGRPLFDVEAVRQAAGRLVGAVEAQRPTKP